MNSTIKIFYIKSNVNELNQISLLMLGFEPMPIEWDAELSIWTNTLNQRQTTLEFFEGASCWLLSVAELTLSGELTNYQDEPM